MPWQEMLLMDQRVELIADYQRDEFDVAELARRFVRTRLPCSRTDLLPIFRAAH